MRAGAAVATAGYGLSRGAARIISCFWPYAGILEYLQNFSPGQNPALVDFAASALGALCGGVAFVVLWRYRSAIPRWRNAACSVAIFILARGMSNYCPIRPCRTERSEDLTMKQLVGFAGMLLASSAAAGQTGHIAVDDTLAPVGPDSDRLRLHQRETQG
jgi:hypothetical protein